MTGRELLNRIRDYELLYPLFVIGTLWLTMSVATSAYITWLERGHHQIVHENVASIVEAAEMSEQIGIIQMQLETTRDKVDELSRSQFEENVRAFQMAFERAQKTAHTEGEQRALSEIQKRQGQLEYELTETVRQGSDLSLTMASAQAREIATMLRDFTKRNLALIEERGTSYKGWAAPIIWLRLFITLVGLIFGVMMGFRIAGRLRKRMAAISVSIEGMSVSLRNLNLPLAQTSQDVYELEASIESIANRVREVVLELQASQRAVIQNERLAAVGQLAASVAHELRNPLTAVKLLVQTGLKRGSRGQNAEQLSIALDEIVRMERTIQNMLDFARPPSASRVCFDLRSACQRAVNLLAIKAQQGQIVLEYSPPDSACAVWGDPEQLHQVFVNLLINGLEAIETQGTLRMEILASSRPSAQANLSPTAAWEVRIIDSGSGIPDSIIDHVFDPFVTSKYRGTGLGLAISRRILAEHGGELFARNLPIGACFTVLLNQATEDLPSSCKTARERVLT